MGFGVLRRAGLLGAAGALVVALGPWACAEGEAEPSCVRNSDCTRGTCFESKCVQECVDAEVDCPKGYVCNAVGRCEYGQGGGSGQGGAGLGGGSTTTTTDTTTTTTSTTTSSSGGNKTELDLCAGDAECAAALSCRPMTKGGKNRCTRACASNQDCMAGTRCVDSGSGVVCLGDDVGRPCADPSPCNFACLQGPGYCTAACVTGSDCPNGYGCMAVGNPPQKVCIRAEAYCSAADPSACVVPAACDESPNMVVGGCTLACSTAADCPRRAAGLSAWACDGLCRRPIDVFGPLEGGYTPTQYACNGQGQPVNLCNDAQHIDFDQFDIPAPPAVSCNSPTTTDGVAGDSCVDSCRYQGGCPYAFACTAVGQVASERIGLCLPVGGGEVGTACQKDGQCAFGYCSAGSCSRDCTDDGVCPTGSTCTAVGGPSVEGAAFRRCQ